MVSQEFISAVTSNNLLRTRIMLKDSFVVDPTFMQLKEMLTYAKKMLPDLVVPFDNEYLEEDQTQWNQDVMNMELVQLVNNFSEVRIAHLQKVVSKVMASSATQAKMQGCRQPTLQRPHQSIAPRAGMQYGANTVPSYATASTPEELRKQALRQVMTEGMRISKVLQTVKDTKRWEPSQIEELEKAAKQLLQATRKYKLNR